MCVRESDSAVAEYSLVVHQLQLGQHLRSGLEYHQFLVGLVHLVFHLFPEFKK